jgi:hypothetical protein
VLSARKESIYRLYISFKNDNNKEMSKLYYYKWVETTEIIELVRYKKSLKETALIYDVDLE